jgi:hypothetical protein
MILPSSVNVFEGELEERSMTTGLHAVKDVYCNVCSNLIGWKYERGEKITWAFWYSPTEPGNLTTLLQPTRKTNDTRRESTSWKSSF